jgi:hypothetical protein
LEQFIGVKLGFKFQNFESMNQIVQHMGHMETAVPDRRVRNVDPGLGWPDGSAGSPTAKRPGPPTRPAQAQRCAVVACDGDPARCPRCKVAHIEEDDVGSAMARTSYTMPYRRQSAARGGEAAGFSSGAQLEDVMRCSMACSMSFTSTLEAQHRG